MSALARTAGVVAARCAVLLVALFPGAGLVAGQAAPVDSIGSGDPSVDPAGPGVEPSDPGAVPADSMAQVLETLPMRSLGPYRAGSWITDVAVLTTAATPGGW
ncbi:MAG TPA: hypothetical protein VMT85_08305 [Thermoanaerobaculia bacterium]|nr:hypothetical protein [Thermoanaerobaculia bacterium]